MNNDKLRREGQCEWYGHTMSGPSPKTRVTFHELDPITHDGGDNDGVYTGPDAPSGSIGLFSESNELDAKTNNEWDLESETSRTDFIRKPTTLTLTNTPPILDGRIV